MTSVLILTPSMALTDLVKHDLIPGVCAHKCQDLQT